MRSFRSRLTLFFVIIVIVPMVSVAFVLFRLIDDNENANGDARVAAQQQVAVNLFRESRDRAGEQLDEVGSDRVLAQSLQSGDTERAQRRAEQLVRFREIERILIVDGARRVVDAGDPDATAPAIRPLQSRSGESFGRLEVSVVDAQTVARRIRQITGLETVVRRDDELLATTLPGAGARMLPQRPADVRVDGREYRVASFAAAGFAGQTVRVSSLARRAATTSAVARSRLTAGGILVAFFLVAIGFAMLVSRSLQQQVATFLDAARRLGRGDFSARAPTQGGDEFAALGEEFNKMSGQLEARLAELQAERERVQGSMRRLGEAVASNLDRDALLQIVVRTAVDGVGADGGRATVAIDGHELEERTRAGSMDGREELVRAVELDALRAGLPREATKGDASAIAHPLRGADGREGVAGLVSVVRSGRPFTPGERDLFHYLAGQAAVSVENVDLHETVARESVTDELTGLANRRGFDDALSGEVERARRFGQKLSLLMLDLDDFKDVNDAYGHQQGDVVLREVARALRDSLREIDEPARYGGEELAVVLPGTDLEGAYLLAERVRARIGDLEVPRMGDPGVGVRVTASVGVAAMPQNASDASGMIAAADAALYEAKRMGKNKSIRAQ